MVNSCALCGGEISFARYGLCTRCFREWTCTGTASVPEWLRIFTKEHHAYEQKKQHQEVPIPDNYEPVYHEPMFGVIEQKYHKHKTRGRPTKLINARTPAE